MRAGLILGNVWCVEQHVEYSISAILHFSVDSYMELKSRKFSSCIKANFALWFATVKSRHIKSNYE